MNFSRYLLTSIAGIVFLSVFCVLCRRESGGSSAEVQRPQSPPSRIISVVPSLTETLFALGLGGRIVAVSDFCHYPPEVEQLPRIGGLYNPNLERMIGLKPDLVLLLTEHTELKARLAKYQIPVLTVDHSSVSGILDSFETIAARCGAEENGRRLRRETEDRIRRLCERTANLPSVRVLAVIDRDLGERKITQVYAAGKNPYFNGILSLAGGENLLSDSLAAVPTISREGIIDKNPDVIIDLSSYRMYRHDEESDDDFRRQIQKDWQSLGETVSAVRSGRIYLVADDFASIPGPRFILFAELLADLLHPK